MIISNNSLSNNLLAISKFFLFVREILKFKHLEVKVDNIFLLLLIKIKFTFADGSSKIFNKAFTELAFKHSILSIKTNLGFLLNDDLFKLIISSLIWFISIDFLSSLTSIVIKFVLDLLLIVLNSELSLFIW